MDTAADGTDRDWVPQACTLPSVEQPFRLAEFDAMLAGATQAERLGEQRLRVSLAAETGLEERVRDLAARESDCCSFFEFDITAHQAGLVLDVRVPAEHANILDALQARATVSG